MAKFDSSNIEQVSPIIYQGDVYYVYHTNGFITSIYARYDNMSRSQTPVEYEELCPALQHLIDDTINK